MAARKNPRSEFGMEVTLYCAKAGITQKDLAQNTGVSYETMKDAIRGKRPARQLVEKVRRIINE